MTIAPEVGRALAQTISAEGGELQQTRAGLTFLADRLEELAEKLDEACYPHLEIYRAAKRVRAYAEKLRKQSAGR